MPSHGKKLWWSPNLAHHDADFARLLNDRADAAAGEVVAEALVNPTLANICYVQESIAWSRSALEFAADVEEFYSTWLAEGSLPDVASYAERSCA